MPAKDLYHDAVRAALEADGWTITHDPLRLSYGERDMYVDLGAERLVGAEKSGRRIAVEVKSFSGQSEMREVEQAIGQFFVYRTVLAITHAGWELHLAVPDEAMDGILSEPLGKLLLGESSTPLISFDPETRRVTQWIPPTRTAT